MNGGGMPWSQARELGDVGEEIACAHLEDLGWSVVERNWRCNIGELDLVAIDPQGELVFCEVKTRRSTRCGFPVEAVGPDKARRLRRLAWAWLADREKRPPSFRIDVIGVLCPPGAPITLQHLQAVA